MMRRDRIVRDKMQCNMYSKKAMAEHDVRWTKLFGLISPFCLLSSEVIESRLQRLILLINLFTFRFGHLLLFTGYIDQPFR